MQQVTLADANALDLWKRSRPIKLGSNVDSGTVCCVVRDASGKRFLLTLQFVVREVGTPVWQPGGVAGGGSVTDIE